MREIKFRAWNIGDKDWLPDIDEFSVCDVNYMQNQGTIILEQYTGFKDKNGLEIYEGDIVSQRISETECANVEVYWDEELCEFGYRYCDEPFYAQFADERNVVGNIHQNPELLK